MDFQQPSNTDFSPQLNKFRSVYICKAVMEFKAGKGRGCLEGLDWVATDLGPACHIKPPPLLIRLHFF